MREITTSGRRRAATIAASIACVAALGTAGPAAAQVGPVKPVDPQAELQKLVCVPDGSVLRPTALCEVPGPSGLEEDRVNPYTEDGTSPGLLGDEGLGNAAPLLGPLL